MSKCQASKRARRHRKHGLHHPSHVPAKALSRFVQTKMKAMKESYKEVAKIEKANIVV